ncbi:DMT family transporter [Frigidibacter oleivorans]|uniref:DMT family transporter n=1 Tax=Frigidibacter oleivorans TaxID=2487129 RepID=UPI000F8D3030|nr:DMT family transporter [Frigidibacter oleivorans]
MDLRAVLMGLAFAFMWSSAFTSARMIVADAAPMHALALRFLVSGVAGVVLARIMGQDWRLTRGEWRTVVIFGLCQNALYLGLYFVAMQWIEASLASIIASSMPLMVALAGWLVFGDRMTRGGVAGLVAGMAGVALIMGSRLSGGADPLGVAFCILGAVALTVATLSMRGTASGNRVMMVVGLQMLVGSAALGLVAVAVEPPHVTFTPRLVMAFLYTCFVPGLLATWVWFLLVGRIGALKAATFHFLNPFFGVAVAAALLGEGLGWVDVLGVAVIAAGILAVQRSRAVQMTRS